MEEENFNMSEDQSLDIEQEEESKILESYCKSQKLVSNVTPLLPSNIKSVVEANKKAMIESLQATIDYIQNHPSISDLDNPEKVNETKVIYQSILEGLWIAIKIVGNFKFNLKQDIFKTLFLLALKCIKNNKIHLLTSIKILKVLRKFPIFYFDLDNLKSYAHEQKLWKDFYEILHETQEMGAKSIVGKQNKNSFKTELQGLLVKGLNKIFALDFDEIYQQMRLDKINFFGLILTSKNTELMNAMVPLGSINKQELAIVIKDLRFYVDKVVKNSKFIIMVKIIFLTFFSFSSKSVSMKISSSRKNI